MKIQTSNAIVCFGQVGDETGVGGPFEHAHGPDDGQPASLGFSRTVGLVDEQCLTEFRSQTDGGCLPTV